jgi:hypothetical protein
LPDRTQNTQKPPGAESTKIHTGRLEAGGPDHRLRPRNPERRTPAPSKEAAGRDMGGAVVRKSSQKRMKRLS